MLAVKKGRPGFSFLICPDSALLLRHLDAMLVKFPPASGDWKRSVFWGDELPGAKFWEGLKQQGLFSENRAIIVRRAHEWPAQVWKSLDESLASGSSSIWPVFCLETEYEKGRFKIPAAIQKTRCFNFSEKQGWHWTSLPLAGKTLLKYVDGEARKRKINLRSDALAFFCDTVRPDAAAIANELDKLELVYADRQIVPEMLNLDAGSVEANAFECIKSLYSGNMAKVWKEVSLGNASSLLFFLIALLARDFHVFWQLNLGKNPYLHPTDAALKRSLATRIGKKGVGKGFVLLADAEYGVKSGRISTEQALDQLLAGLASIFSQSSV